MKNLLTYFLLPIVLLFNSGISDNSVPIPKTPIRCGPSDMLEAQTTYFDPRSLFARDISSVRDGDWFTGSTWSTGQVPSEFDHITVGHKLTSNNTNIIIRGSLKGTKGGLQFLNIDISKVVGGGMEPLPTDVGLWVMGEGQLNLQGEKKTSWTYSNGVNRGARTLIVDEADGWKVGDVVMIVPTRTPNNVLEWDERIAEPVDAFAKEFEERTITAISGKTITLDRALDYDHANVVASEKTFRPEVANLTRSFVIEGENKKEAHIFIRSSKSQVVENIEGRYLGQVKGTTGRPDLQQGRYGLHFHWCQDGSRGSIVQGNAFHHIRNRVYVPHVSNGIIFRDNVSFKSYREAMWWDERDMSHDITYDHNLIALVHHDGRNNGVSAILYGMGDGNVSINNTVVYGHKGDIHARADHFWEAENDGVWKHRGNFSHSSVTALASWQNSLDPHTIENFTCYNTLLGVSHGAYFNAYNYLGGYFYNTTFEEKAGSLNTLGVQVKDVLFDKTLIDFLPFPGQSTPTTPVRLINNRYINGSQVRMNAFAINGENPLKIVHLVNYDGPAPSFTAASLENSYFMVQDKAGNAREVRKNGTRTIPAFAPLTYGSGEGLLSTYYNNTTLTGQAAVTRIEPALHYDGWGESDKIKAYNNSQGSLPKILFAVHNKITGREFSARYLGSVEAQSTEGYTFRVNGSIASRLWVDDKLILDSWTEKEDLYSFATSSIVNLEKGKKYKLKLEIMNQDNRAQLRLQWKSPGMLDYFIIPQYQLFPDTLATPPPVNRPPVSNAGPDREITLPDSTLKIEGIATDPDNNVKTAIWTGPTGVEIKQDLSEISHAMVKVRTAGTYTLRLTVTDQGQPARVSVDEMVLTVRPKPVITYYSKRASGVFTRNNCVNGTGSQVTFTVKDSAYTSTVSQNAADAQAIQVVNTNGQAYANANGTCTPNRTILLEFIISGRKYVVYSDHPSTPVQ